MDFGLVLQLHHPPARTVELAKTAESYGFHSVWAFDSHILWEECNVVFAAILERTHKLVVGPLVTNPVTRHPTVTASTFATLNDLYGNRTICGIGRGDSALRTLGRAPCTIAELRDAVRIIKGLGNGEAVEHGESTLRLPWARESRLPVWVAAYGPKMLAVAGEVADGLIVQLGDPDLALWMMEHVRAAADNAGRDPGSIKFCVAAPAYVTGAHGDVEHAREQCRWFGAMVGNHVADIVERYGAGGAAVPKALSDYVASRESYDYNQHGQAGNTHAQYVPDSIVDRFCLLGGPEEHIARLREYQDLGVDQFALYLQHDAPTETLRAYGEKILPALREDKALG
ncbi:5,10-methylenetetrahydromethanopterin reductase [Segniliparus rotundus DSM 44985]|uniref:5,10-methylenetetrahydromethanopterin reductase n=1 Tax=Segniliparus rotundus (strain ATCC BAA-972 / CDC 1076 / CIP 108378 / DSM 44985 / JCM 13578) TaxID=640132 RepID=D6Z7W1_SEGRD|nr:TIGR03842 family LLM class F420-dependent oxidoreductase [Segniliparus rotundus]ADG98041.1 5,10-methylenetetrahydromethanopterin reductase [Segniliparus rotundus DSM 44985]